MAELYAKPFETIETGYNPQQTQSGGKQSEMDSYLESLPPEERQKAIERINAPLSGEELSIMANSGEKVPTIEEYAEIEKWHKNQEISIFEGLGKLAEGGAHVMDDLTNAFGSFMNDPTDATKKMPATAIEAFSQGTRNFYGMLAQSQNTDSVLFKVKDFLNGTGTIEDRYKQYLDALKFNKDSAELAEGKQTLVMDKDLINHEVTQAMAYIADPTLFIPFGKVASTGLRAVGLGEKLTMAGARATAIKNSILGNTLKWGAGQPLEFLGGAVRNTIDYGLEKGGQAFEATTGISGKEFAQTARMSGIGFSASAIAGHAVPYASTISDAYLVGSSAKGFGEALTLMGETMSKNKFGRGINSWAVEAMEQAEKNGVVLSPHAKGLLKTLNAVDPLFAYSWNGLEGAAEGAMIGGGLGYLSGGKEGMYSGMGAGIALGGVGATAGKVVADVTGGTGVARRAVQAKMVIEGHKTTNPEKAMFFEAMQKATEAKGGDVDLVNGIISGIDKIAPNFEFHGLTVEQFKLEAIKKGYNPETGKFVEWTSNFQEFGTDREAKRRALSILRGIGSDFIGDRKAFLDAVEKHGKVFTPEEFDKMTREHIISAKARQLLIRFGFQGANGTKSDWSVIDTPAQKKYLEGLLKGLTPEEREMVKKQYEGVSSIEAQQEFIKQVDVSRDDLFDIKNNKNRRTSKYNPLIDSFNKLTKTQKEAVLKEIDGQHEIANKLGGKHKVREYYEARSWAEAWTDAIVKKYESNRQGALDDIKIALTQEMKKNGGRTIKGVTLIDKLRAEGFVDKDGNVLRQRNLLQADMTLDQFKYSKGGVIRREADGKTHMYINLNTMGDETFPHELFHTIMRESPMKDHFTKSLIQKLIGTFDAQGNLVRNGEVNIDQVRKFFRKYIDLTTYNEDGTTDIAKADKIIGLVDAALSEFQQSGGNKKISDKARGLLENYAEEFGAYYFSHWLMGRNRNTLFFGGELKGVEGLVERVKDSFMDFWQSKISKTNPSFDFSNGLNEAFNRSNGLGRISAMDYFMRDMVRAASNANKESFRPDSMTLENLRDFERGNGLRNLTTTDGNRRLNPVERRKQNFALGKQGFKIISGLDKTLRTSKDTIDENGKPVITGRLSEAELDALVKGGIVPRAWADKVNQGYAMLDGTTSNIYSAGYLGFSEQTTDASYPRLYGKDVAFKNRKALLYDIETKIKADGTFYTLFHNIDLAVVEQRGNHLWQNVDYRNLWDGDRGAMEADFFRYISNASKASTDPKKLDSAALLERGDGLGAQRRDVIHQMAGMALQTGDSYKHQPIATIPEGIRHSVTTFNIDGLTTPRVEQGARYDIDMGNAHKFIRENWQPDDMKQEKTPNGVLMTHASGFKFSNVGGKTVAYTSAGRKIGTFDNIKSATNAAKNEYHKVYDNIEKGTQDSVREQNNIATKFQPLDEKERAEAIRLGDVFALASMKAFIGDRPLLRQTRDEHIYQRALEAIQNPEQLLQTLENEAQKNKPLNDELSRLYNEIDKIHQERVDLYNQWKEYDKKKPPQLWTGADDINHPEYKAWLEGSNKFEQLVNANYALEQKALSEKNLFEQKHKAELADNVALNELETLKEYTTDTTTREEIANMLVERVKANTKQKQYSGLLETLFAGDYDDKIQTGKPFVAVTTHGTGAVELMLSRLFAADKLGTVYNITSSRMGSFSAGSERTSRYYAKIPNRLSSEFKYVTVRVADHSEQGMAIVHEFRAKLEDFYGKEYDIAKKEQESINSEIERRQANLEKIPEHLLNEWGRVNSLPLYLDRILYSKDRTSSLIRGEIKDGKTPEFFKEYYDKIKNYAISNDIYESNVPDKQMQLRKVIRMDNPYVVVDPRSYEEHYISPHMKKAMEAGHDGIVFKRFADGGERDNVYVVFKDFMKDNIKVIDTSFDEQGVPRGSDETGRKLLGGRDLKLSFQPDETLKPSEELIKRAKAAGYKPTVYYHGTDRDFTEFKADADKQDGGRLDGTRRTAGMFFFTPHEDEASGIHKGTNKVMPVFLKADNSFNSSSGKSPKFNAQERTKIKEFFRDNTNYPNKDYLMDVIDGYLDRKELGIPLNKYLTRPQRAELLKSLGFDSIIDKGDHLVVFDPEQIKSAKELTYDDQGNEIPLSQRFDKTNKDIRYQPDEPTQGGRTYDHKSKEFRTKFIGKWAEENPDRIKGYNIEFIDRGGMGGYRNPNAQNVRIRLQDNSKKGSTIDVGHITAQIDHNSRVATLSSNIAPEYRGNKLSYVLYSEMAERLRSMGVKYVDGQIVNPEGIPVKVREKIIGETMMLGRDGSFHTSRPISQNEASRIIKRRQAMGGQWEGIDVVNELDFNAWYQPDERIGTRSSNVKLLLDGIASGRILRTSSYKGLGLEDANLIAHTPDTAKIGQVTAGDKALADLQGGIFYAIANGKKIWASNFAGEGETNILVNFANQQLKTNANGKTYIMLVKADNSKIFASVDGARGVSNIFKHLNESGVMSDIRYSRALKNSAEMYLNMKGLDGLSKDELYARIDDALLRSKENKISFENRAEFTREIARQLNDAGAFDSKKSKDALVKSFHKGFERGFSIVEMERVFGNLMAEDIIKDVPKGHVYGAIEITSPLKETKESDHRGYDASIEQENGKPSKLIIFDKTAHVTEIVNKKSGEEISMFKAGEGAYHSYTGGQIPYQEVKGKSNMPFQPAEGWRDWKSERTSVGSVIKNTAGYVIMVQGDKFKVYNPYKSLVGIYNDEQQAKRRVQRDEPKQ